MTGTDRACDPCAVRRSTPRPLPQWRGNPKRRRRRSVEIAVGLDPVAGQDDGLSIVDASSRSATARAWSIVSRAAPATAGEHRRE